MLEKSKNPDCFQRSKVPIILFTWVYVKAVKFTLNNCFHFRDHVIFKETQRSNDNDRLVANRDVQSQKNLSFPPIAHEIQKQNTHNVR